MDFGLKRQPLSKDIASFRLWLASAKPPEVIEAEKKLSEPRAVRAAKRTALQEMQQTKYYEAQANGTNVKTSDEMKSLAAELVILEEQVAAARYQLEQARGQWSPTFFQQAKPHLAAVVPELEKALETIEACSVMHGLFDDYVSDHFRRLGIAPPRSDVQLTGICQHIRQFLKRWRQ